ncbi:uncharacterized protein FOMMEDRAFT_148185, partial [Fomitiporia mediterranea MF3/22]|uniref:uncharacterized protein n=1 Tax=Fomitiporia mediterranea (strain MF3/22) TaxID=694068 RepID=UPI0004408972
MQPTGARTSSELDAITQSDRHEAAVRRIEAMMTSKCCKPYIPQQRPLGPGLHEIQFHELMRNFPGVKSEFRFLPNNADFDFLVYRPTNEKNKVKLLAGTSGGWDPKEEVFAEINKFLITLVQPLDRPPRSTNKIAELHFFARKEGWHVQWFVITTERPYSHQLKLTEPNGKTYTTAVECSESGAWHDARKYFLQKCKKNYEFTWDKDIAFGQEETARAMRDMEIVHTPRG